MRRAGVLLLWLAIGLWAAACANAGERRVALVVGNADYANAPRLKNPRKDAEDVAGALRRIGFEVITGVDMTEDQMQDAAIDFSRTARGSDIALFYYAGHAMQYDGVNYLMPVDAKLTDEEDLRRLIRADEIVRDLRQARSLRILVLDACRDNPIADSLATNLSSGSRGAVSLARGLAKIDNQEGMIISFSTQAGKTADDGTGRNSPYSAAFLRHIETREDVVSVFSDVSYDVHAATDGKQLPELSISLAQKFYLNGLPASPGGTTAPPPIDQAAIVWESVKGTSDRAVLDGFINQYPDSPFASAAREKLTQLAGAVPDVQVRSPGKSEYPFQAILTQASNLYANPSRIAESIRMLNVGETLTVRGEADDAPWYLVRDRKGADGYVPKGQLRRLN